MDELEEFDELDILDGDLDTTYKGKLPAGLQALCILTFIGSGVILLKDFFTYFFYSVANNINGEIVNKAGHHELDVFFGSLPLIYILEVVSCLGTIAAAILMLRMNLRGFYIYVVSTIVYAIAILWFWLSIPEMQINEGFIFLMFVYLAAPIGFIIMYGANRKYMN